MNKMMLAAVTAVALVPGVAQAMWNKGDVTDHLDGKIGVGTETIGSAEIRGRTVASVLSIDCQKNSTTVGFSHKNWFVHFSRPALRSKLDDGPIKTLDVRPSMNNKWAGLWGGAGIPFAKSLYGAKTLKVSILDHLNGEETTMTFDVAGAEDGLADVAAACKWGK